MKKNSILIALACFLILTMACDPDHVLENSSDNSSDNPSDSTTYTEQAADYVWVNTDVTEITLNNSSISANSSAVTVSGTNATITQAGYYSISGNLTNGQIIVDADTGVVKISLKGVTLNNASGSPFYIKKASKAIIFLEDATVSTITDAASYSNSGEPNAAIFSNVFLAFTGTGSLTVKGNYNDGISSDDEVIINSGNITVTAKDDAIRGKDYLKINGGTIKATATTGHALKSDNADDKGYGYVKVDGGSLNLTSSQADGIHGVKRVIINGGELSIAAAGSQGLKSDSLVTVNGGNTVISSSREGVESPVISITNGTISITSSDDGFNATMGSGSERNDNSLLSISGGNVYISASGGDGLDSNGNILMTGGTVVVHGPRSQPEVGLDYNGTFNISGGFLVISGIYSNMTQATSTSSTQCALKITINTALSASTLFHVQDADGNQLLTFKPDKNYSSIVFSSESLKKSSSYSIYTGGTSTGTLVKGLYTGGTYSGGTLKKTFTVSGTVTSVSL